MSAAAVIPRTGVVLPLRAGAQRFDEAQSMLAGAHSSLVASRGESAHISEAALMLATLYDAWNKPDQAAAWRAKAR